MTEQIISVSNYAHQLPQSLTQNDLVHKIRDCQNLKEEDRKLALHFCLCTRSTNQLAHHEDFSIICSYDLDGFCHALIFNHTQNPFTLETPLSLFNLAPSNTPYDLLAQKELSVKEKNFMVALPAQSMSFIQFRSC